MQLDLKTKSLTQQDFPWTRINRWYDFTMLVVQENNVGLPPYSLNSCAMPQKNLASTRFLLPIWHTRKKAGHVSHNQPLF